MKYTWTPSSAQNRHTHTEPAAQTKHLRGEGLGTLPSRYMLPHCKRQAKSWGAHFMASMGPAGVFCLPPLCTRRCLPGAAPLLEDGACRFFEGGLPSPVPSSSSSSRRSPAKGLGRSRGNLCFAACPSCHVASCCTDSAHPAQHRLQRKTATLAQIAILPLGARPVSLLVFSSRWAAPEARRPAAWPAGQMP